MSTDKAVKAKLGNTDLSVSELIYDATQFKPPNKQVFTLLLIGHRLCLGLSDFLCLSSWTFRHTRLKCTASSVFMWQCFSFLFGIELVLISFPLCFSNRCVCLLRAPSKDLKLKHREADFSVKLWCDLFKTLVGVAVALLTWLSISSNLQYFLLHKAKRPCAKRA